MNTSCEVDSVRTHIFRNHNQNIRILYTCLNCIRVCLLALKTTLDIEAQAVPVPFLAHGNPLGIRNIRGCHVHVTQAGKSRGHVTGMAVSES